MDNENRNLKEKKKSKVFSFRLPEDEHEKLTSKIKEAGFDNNKSEFFRIVYLDNKTEIIARAPISDDKKKLIYLYNKSSNNLNQLAKQVNTHFQKGIISESVFNKLLVNLSNISELMRLGIKDAD